MRNYNNYEDYDYSDYEDGELPVHQDRSRKKKNRHQKTDRDYWMEQEEEAAALEAESRSYHHNHTMDELPTVVSSKTAPSANSIKESYMQTIPDEAKLDITLKDGTVKTIDLSRVDNIEEINGKPKDDGTQTWGVRFTFSGTRRDGKFNGWVNWFGANHHLCDARFAEWYKQWNDLKGMAEKK